MDCHLMQIKATYSPFIRSQPHSLSHLITDQIPQSYKWAKENVAHGTVMTYPS